ncbi:MAG TPA: inorganic diphosphatase [Nevskiaceae bacterium]|nr:inorganic diphosphatase [Nevskiaceae bacterium]
MASLPARAGRGLVNVVIDTPKGSRNKYKLDPDTGLIKLSRILPAGMAFPHDFGFIPHTLADDGDALDVLVIVHAPSFAGCLMQVKLLGLQRGVQREGRRWIRNDRLVGVPVTATNDPEFQALRDVPRSWFEEIRHFFVAYNHAQGRAYRPENLLGPAAADKALRTAEARYRKEGEG